MKSLSMTLDGSVWPLSCHHLLQEDNGYLFNIQDTILLVSVSPNGKIAAALHESGALSLWDYPSLRSRKFWDLVDQVFLHYSLNKVS